MVIPLCFVGEKSPGMKHKLIFQTGFWGLGTGQLHVGVLVKVLWWGFVWDAAVNLCARRHHRCGSVIRVPPPEKRRGTTVYSSSHGQGTSLHPSTATSQREEKRGNLELLLGAGHLPSFWSLIQVWGFPFPSSISLCHSSLHKPVSLVHSQVNRCPIGWNI